jgi:hypothetical protein
MKGPFTLVSITRRQVSGATSQKRVGHAATGIVHQNIEPPEPLDRGVDNPSAVVFPRHVGDKRENPRLAAALPNLLCDSFDLGALARRSRDDMDPSLRKSQDHCPAEAAASACHDGNVAQDLARLHIGFH